MNMHKIGTIGQHDGAKRFVLTRKHKRQLKKAFRGKQTLVAVYANPMYYTAESALGRDYCRYMLNKLR
jgi:hypothetical protein